MGSVENIAAPDSFTRQHLLYKLIVIVILYQMSCAVQLITNDNAFICFRIFDVKCTFS